MERILDKTCVILQTMIAMAEISESPLPSAPTKSREVENPIPLPSLGRKCCRNEDEGIRHYALTFKIYRSIERNLLWVKT